MPPRKTIEWCYQLAEAKGGRCLSTEYKNAHTKYLWECSRGHQWEVNANAIQQGRWCPHCAGLAPHNLQWLQELAIQRGGECLATEYKNNRTKYYWKCSRGHQWEAIAHNIQQGQWCPHCAKNFPHNLQWLCKLASERDGRCLATEYENINAKYPWECSEGHRWSAKADNVRNGNWCPHCAQKAPHDLQWLHDLAAERGGKCLSTKYKNAMTRYLWECSKGHRWEALPNNIRRGNWCPRCVHHTSQGELEVLEFIQQFYPDAQKRKGLLKNKHFELDIYVPSKNIAIEYDGYWWHHSKWAKERGHHRRHLAKTQQCADIGIQLLRIDDEAWQENREAVQGQILDFILKV